MFSLSLSVRPERIWWMMKRSEYCGKFSKALVGRQVSACGWVQAKRDMGGVIFLDLRDREGVLQVVVNQERVSPEGFAAAERVRAESVLEVAGLLALREEETYNPAIATGEVELRAERLSLLSEAQALPFAPEDAGDVREELRLKYRYLDLRRGEMVENLRFRHRLVSAAQRFLDGEGFLQVETPMLTKSTPEGARDYLVPSRVHRGAFYALPQSPQIFKQLLMVGGIDRYYQVARCFRDEDLRADRQPEFTQVDMEMSFVEQEDVLEHLEKLFRFLVREAVGTEPNPFPRLTWQEAMDVYGSDKPDLRFGLPIVELTGFALHCGFGVFRKAAEEGGVVRAINIPGGAGLTRSEIEFLTERAMGYGAKGMAWIALRPDGELYSVLTKYFTEEERRELLELCGAKAGDFILFCADKLPTVRRTLGGLRLDIAQLLKLPREGYCFLFVTDFPEFEYSEEEGRYLAMHHPFTMPYEEDIPFLLTQPERVRAQAYDVVLNGVELGSGSIRIHRQEVQQKMFEALGFSREKIQEQFGFLVEAFRYGVPPHGGFAFGLDRLAMLLLGAPSLREVIAFPKLKDASCPLTSAPAPAEEGQLALLGIGLDREARTGREQRAYAPLENTAGLAKLSLEAGERAEMEQALEEMLCFAGRLAQIDTGDVAPTAHVLPVQNVFRRDERGGGLSAEEVSGNAPAWVEGCFLVPQVIEGE